MPGSFRFSVLQAMESWAEPGNEARLYTETKGGRKFLDIYCKQSPHTGIMLSGVATCKYR